MSNKYLVLLKSLLVVLVFTIWVDSGFPVGGGNSRNSLSNEPIIPEYSYGLGYIPLEGKVESAPLISSTYTAPSSWDWRNATYNSVTGDWTTVAKNQGGCGSCWDFAAHGALEAIINIRNNTPNLDLDLSEQYILSCYSGGWECGGSNAYYAYEYMYDNEGAIPETCFPYYANDGIPCSDKCANWQNLLVPISYYGGCPSPGRDAIKNYIYEYGPLCLAFSVYADFYAGSPSFDDDGVYQYDGVSSLRGGHQIVAVGYEDTPGHPDYDGYWICKNSWGATWGPWNDGCFGIAYGECDIEQEAVYVDYDKPQSPPFIRGDYDANGELSMADAISLLLWKYYQPGGVPPPCEDAADYDDNGEIAMADAQGILLYKYHQPGWVPPSPPYPDCGSDPTSDALDCQSYPPCGTKTTKFVISSLPMSVGAASNVMKVEDCYLAEDGLVVVPVMLTNEVELRGFEFTVNFDPTLVSAVKVRGGDDYDFFGPWIDNDVGKVTVGCIPDLNVQRPFAPGQRVVAEISFKAKADVSLELSNVALYGLGAEVVAAQWIDGIVKVEFELPKGFILHQNYPNPFNPTTLIRYALPMDCQVRLDVYNVIGQRVATPVDGQQKAGYKVVTWNAQDLTSGVYFCRLTAGNYISIKRMILLK